jgi:hypothetical protein
MEALGFQVSKTAVEQDGETLVQALEAVAQENTVGDKFIHSIILTWDEAYLIEPQLMRLQRGREPVYVPYMDSSLPFPKEGLTQFGSYKGIRLFVTKPVNHVEPAHNVVSSAE